MLIAVISDTHKMNRYINIAKEYVQEADVLIHLGDNSEDIYKLGEGFKGDTYCVRGNCDESNAYPKEQCIELEGFKIFFTHGDLYGVKRSVNMLYYKAKELGADIALFGHTHQQMIEEYNGVILMNPGSISLPNIRERYVGFIELEKGKNPNCYLKEVNV